MSDTNKKISKEIKSWDVIEYYVEHSPPASLTNIARKDGNISNMIGSITVGEIADFDEVIKRLNEYEEFLKKELKKHSE